MNENNDTPAPADIPATPKEKLADTVQRAKEGPAGAILGLFIFYLVGMTLWQEGLGGLGTLLLCFVVVAGGYGFLAGLFQDTRGKPWEFLSMCLLVAAILWMWIAGSFQSWSTALSDFAGFMIGGIGGIVLLGIVMAIFRRNTRSLTDPDANANFLPAWSFLMGWIGITLVTLWRQDPLPHDVKRFADIGPAQSIVPAEATRWQRVCIGLALSGGGYRAAVYHAGVLHALEKLGLKPAVLSTVSGGSIIGSYYAIGGDPVAFKDAVAQGRFNLKRELLLAHNAVRLPFPVTVPIIDVRLFPWYGFSRRDAQASLLRRTLLGDEQSWRTPANGQPGIVIATTDLTFGQQVGFIPDGAVVVWLDHMSEGFRRDAWRLGLDLDLADRVAISGGFPLAFPAAATDVEAVPAAASGRGRRPLLLADGGIVDNSGFMMLQAVDRLGAEAQMQSDVFLVSDAGAIFGVEPELDAVGQVMRATDVSGALGRTRTATDRAKPQLFFSAQDHFLPPDKQFRMYNGEKDQFSGEAGIHFSFDPAFDYPEPVLDEIVNLLARDSRQTAADVKARFRKTFTGLVSDRREWVRVLSHQPRNGPCVPDANFPGLCDAFELRKLVRLSIADQLTVFRESSTLDDQPSADRVESLYSLGQLLVYLQWPQLQRAMDAAAGAPLPTDTQTLASQ